MSIRGSLFFLTEAAILLCRERVPQLHAKCGFAIIPAMNKVLRLLRLVTVFSACALATLTGTQTGFAAEKKSVQKNVPETCVPASREHLGWWKNMNDSFNAIARERNAKIVFLGDSITDLWRRPAAQRGGKEIWDKRIAPLDAVNFGISGDKTQNILWRLDSGNLAGKMSPKLVVLMIGTNNWNNKPEDTAQGVKAILEKIRAQHPKTKVLLLAVFPRGADKTDARRRVNEKLNAMIKKYADNRSVYWLDINKIFIEKDKKDTLPTSVMPDLLHPNEEGYRRWADAVIPTVKKLAGN